MNKFEGNRYKIYTKPDGDMATVNVTFMKCKAAFFALAVLLKTKVHGYPPVLGASRDVFRPIPY